MIKIINELPDMPVDTMSLARIFAAEKAFGGSTLQNDLWVQSDGNTITAVISMSGGCMNIYYCGGNTEELRHFLDAISPAEIFTEYETAVSLGLNPIRVRNMLRFYSEGKTLSLEDFSLSKLYERLSLGSDVDIHLPPFEIFAPDVSHRLRHLAARAVVKDYGAALAFTYDGGAAMTGIALSPDFRGRGLGKKLLAELLLGIRGDFFVAANDTNTKFYENFGFALSGKVGYWRL